MDSFSKAAHYWLIKISLTHFRPVSHFYTPWKRQKTFTRVEVKIFRKKSNRVKRGNEKVLMKIYNIHYIYCLLYYLTNLSPWLLERRICQIVYFFSTKHSRDSHVCISTTSNISFQLKRTWSSLIHVLDISYEVLPLSLL